MKIYFYLLKEVLNISQLKSLFGGHHYKPMLSLNTFVVFGVNEIFVAKEMIN